MKDLYKILNVTKESTDKEISKSYKKLAFQYHPDKNKDPEAELLFRDISEAYEILIKPDKRKIYDQFGYEAACENIDDFNPIDLFQSLFNVDFAGAMKGGNIFMFSDLSSAPFPPGFNLQCKMKYSLDVTLEELYSGTTKEFTIKHTTRDGILKNTKYVINIKKGSKNNDNIIVKEGGNYIPELDVIEDLIIQINELPHNNYKRKNDDLYIEKDIKLVDALCGCKITINHFSEEITIQINEIIKPNSLFKVKNKGMPIKKDETQIAISGSNEYSEYGDLIIDFNLIFPKKLDQTRVDILKKVLNYKENETTTTTLVTANYFKNKEDIMKEIINDNDYDDEPGCIQQ